MVNSTRSGQVGLLLLVIVGVVVALVMSIASRSLSDTVLSRQERESSAAFSVAESGIENAFNMLRQGNVPTGAVSLSDSTLFVNGSYLVSPTTSYSLYVPEGETAHLDLTNSGPTVEIYWTKKNDNSEDLPCIGEGSGMSPASLEINAVSSTLATHTHGYYNFYNGGGSCSVPSNGFANVSVDGGSEYRSRLSYSVPAGTTALRIKPLYAGASIAVAGISSDTQLYLVQASASGGDAQKEIEVRRGLDAPASIFDYAVFSGGTIVK